MMTRSFRMSAKSLALPLGMVASLISGCAMGRVDERLAFWQEARATHLKPGTPIVDARDFFRSQGNELRCAVEGSGVRICSATEWNLGHRFLMQYGVNVTIHLSDTETIEDVEVARLGVGL